MTRLVRLIVLVGAAVATTLAVATAAHAATAIEYGLIAAL